MKPYVAVLRRSCATLSFLTFPVLASAAPIPIAVYVEPNNVYQNNDINPCIFNGREVGADSQNRCKDDPADWPNAVGPTGTGNTGTFTLTQSYTATDWNNFVGSQFVVGFDANDTSIPQTLDYFRIYIDNVLTYELTNFSLDAVNNGGGWADFVLAVGCTTTEDVANNSLDRCLEFLPFILPSTATSLRFDMQFVGNDGDDRVFALVSACPQNEECEPLFPPDPLPIETPEPGTLALFGIGLSSLAAAARRRKNKRS